MNFYLLNGTQSVGPYSIEQIQSFLGQGLITTKDQIWAEGWTEWLPIENVPGINNAPARSSMKDPGATNTAYDEQQRPTVVDRIYYVFIWVFNICLIISVLGALIKDFWGKK